MSAAGTAWACTAEIRATAPVRFLGWQERHGRRPIALFCLEAEIPGHPADSSVTALTLLAAGYRLPAVPCAGPDCTRAAVWVAFGYRPDREQLQAEARCGVHAWSESELETVHLVPLAEAMQTR